MARKSDKIPPPRGAELRRLREDRKWTQTELAEKMPGRITYETISNWERQGWRKASIDVLLTGVFGLEANPFAGMASQAKKPKKAKGNVPSKEDEAPVTKTVLIPRVVGALQAGKTGYDLQVDKHTLTYVEQVPVPAKHIKRNGIYCVIRVEGRSMEPQYYDGDEVLVNLREATIGDLKGKIVAAWVPEVGGALIKQLKLNHTNKGCSLHSINPDFPDIPVNEKQPYFYAYEVEAITYRSLKRPKAA